MSIDIEQRRSLLSRLFLFLEIHEDEILQALKLDLGKSEGESYLTEMALSKKETTYALKNLKKWTRRKWVFPSISNWPSIGFLIPEPVGRVLIIGPWNYPFLLMINPLISAIAAGNEVVLKPSELAPATSSIIVKLVSFLNTDKIQVVEGGIPETTELLKQKFDHIFYTGNGGVGKIVMTAAAAHLTPVTLELGGKSPCVIFADADLKMAAKRIVWGKFTNAGQTCVAPDYLLLEEGIKDQFIGHMKNVLNEFFGNDYKRAEYTRIINHRHFDRLEKLLFNEDKIILNGERDRDAKLIAPTILEATVNSASMQDEIFGPILPIMSFKEKHEIIDVIKKHPNPLAAYLYSTDPQKMNWFEGSISAGGICINDNLLHMADMNLPFGGVGPSGMGRYRGKFGFDTFTHYKPVLRRFNFLDIPLRYPPFSNKLAKIKAILRWV